MGAAMLFVLSIYIEERDYIGDNPSFTTFMYVRQISIIEGFIHCGLDSADVHICICYSEYDDCPESVIPGQFRSQLLKWLPSSTLSTTPRTTMGYSLCVLGRSPLHT